MCSEQVQPQPHCFPAQGDNRQKNKRCKKNRSAASQDPSSDSAEVWTTSLQPGPAAHQQILHSLLYSLWFTSCHGQPKREAVLLRKHMVFFAKQHQASLATTNSCSNVNRPSSCVPVVTISDCNAFSGGKQASSGSSGVVTNHLRKKHQSNLVFLYSQQCILGFTFLS